MSKQNPPSELLAKKGIFDKLRLSGVELSHIGVAWLIFIIAFIPQTLVNRQYGLNYDSSMAMFQVTIMAFALGFAFIFHELGHKFSAQYFHAKAEFKLDQRGLLVSVISIAMGFYLLMPGAVFWNSNLSKYSNIRGRVSACGPIVNLYLASLSLGLFIFADSAVGSIGWILFNFGIISFQLNIYLGIFNMIPLWILDGKKIYEWSEMVWLSYLIMFISLILAVKIVIPTYKFYFFLISI